MRKNNFISLICATVAFLIVAGLSFAGCGTGEENASSAGGLDSHDSGLPYEGEELVLSGSTTLLQVSGAWADAFMKEYGGTVIINGGGSGGGIADLINGVTDLANASRQIKDEELDAGKNAGYDIQEYTVLYDGIAVIVSSNVPVEDLTIEQLSKIYTGEITNWKEVGGDDVGIVVVARDSSSGTGEYFLEEVVQMGKTLEDNDYSENALRLQSNADVVNQIKDNDHMISYIGLGYLGQSLKSVKVEGVEASVETVKDGSYPISRGLYVYSPSKELEPIAGAYLDFVMGDDGQEIGLEEGFVPIN